MLDKFLSLLPPDAPYFYMQANDELYEEQAGFTFTRQRVGINMLKTVLRLLSKESGIEVRYTNHSFCATSITHMFNSGTTTVLQCIPVTCLRGPRLLVSGNVHVSWNYMRGKYTSRGSTHVKVYAWKVYV